MIDLTLLTPYHYFAESARCHVLYCKTVNVKNFVNYRVWSDSFPLSIWSIAFALTLLFAIVISKFRTSGAPFFHKLFSLLSIIFKDTTQVPYSPNTNANFLYFVVFIFFIQTIFENTLTSVLVSPSKPKLYQNLKEMLHDGVKIAAYDLGDTNKFRFKLDFHYADVGSIFEASFVRLTYTKVTLI